MSARGRGGSWWIIYPIISCNITRKWWFFSSWAKRGSLNYWTFAESTVREHLTLQLATLHISQNAITSWCFQPSWKILVNLDAFLILGVKIKNLWNHHPVFSPTTNQVIVFLKRKNRGDKKRYREQKRLCLTPNETESWSCPFWMFLETADASLR